MDYPDKFVIILALTSNVGAYDFQFCKDDRTGDLLYETVLKKTAEWGSPENIMYVTGATKAEKLKNIRNIIPEHFLLVPGVGAQGGSLEEVATYGKNSKCGLLVNSSRGIIFADNTKNFAKIAAQKAKELSLEMKKYL